MYETEDLVLRDFMAASQRTLIKENDPDAWARYQSVKNSDAFYQKKRIFGFEVVEPSSGDARAYLVVSDDDSVFKMPRAVAKKNTGAEKYERMYLVHFVCLYLLLMFFSGEDEQILVRSFISKEALMAMLNEFCSKVEKADAEASDMKEEYGVDFVRYMRAWNQKGEGVPEATASTLTRYGILNKAVRFLNGEGLVTELADGRINPTKRLEHLMDYTLRKERGRAIAEWFEEVNKLCQE